MKFVSILNKDIDKAPSSPHPIPNYATTPPPPQKKINNNNGSQHNMKKNY